MDIARGYEPVSKLDANIMASRRALVGMNFPESEIDKVETGLKARKQMFKAIKRRFHPNLFDKLFKVKEDEPQPLSCDVCKMSVYVMDYSPPSPLPIPPGVVIDYTKGKAYILCGTCQILLSLEATELGLLINGIKNGYGYVDLDSIEKLIDGDGSNEQKNTLTTG